MFKMLRRTSLTHQMEDKRALFSQKKVLVVVAVPMTITAFLLPYLRRLSEQYDLTIVSSGRTGEVSQQLPHGVSFRPVDIRRAIHPLADARALLTLIRLMRTEEFAMVQSVTPKAGLLSMLAGWFTRTPIRLHYFTGQVWATRTGFFRWMLKGVDRLIASCATHLLADSHSQKAFLVEEQVVASDRIDVLGRGSISGVDLQRFQPDAALRARIRESLGYGCEDVLGLFVGRLNRDKGVLDLVEAFARASPQLPTLALLLVGPDEENLAAEISRISRGNRRLRVLGATTRPEEFMAAADFFCLPSYREGFGSVVIEAAACGLPAMASAIYGLTDAIENGRSGCLHPARDVAAIAALLERFTVDRGLRQAMGVYARQRATADFSTDTVVSAQFEFVNHLLVGHAVNRSREVPSE